MSLFNSQTIFSLLFTLLVGVALYYYIRYKCRILELNVREQAKVLQSVIMNMNTNTNNNENITSMVQNRSQEEIISDSINQDMNRFRQVNSKTELIEVSDDDDSESSGGSSDSESSSDSDSESSSSDSDSEGECEDEGEQGVELIDNGTRKILFTDSNESRVVEHLNGPDVKVIELSHPLYSKNSNEEYTNTDHTNGNENNGDDEDDEDDEDDGDDEDEEDEDSDSESLQSAEHDIDCNTNGGTYLNEIHEIHEIKENNVTNEVKNEIHLETDTISEDNSLNNLSVKTIFKVKDNKDNKEDDAQCDYNSMNVTSLRQRVRSKLSADGKPIMSEASVNKLTKKELIKHLS
jgi:hypothetical protein